MRHVQFPTAFPHCVEGCPIEIREGVARRAVGGSGDQRGDIEAVDFFVGLFSVANGGERGKKIERRDEFVSGPVGFNPLWPLDDAGLANAAFEAGEFPSAERSSASGVIPVGKERAVVAQEDKECAPIEVVGFQRIKQCPDGSVQFLNGIAIQARVAASAKLLGSGDWHVRHDVGEVQEERFRFVAFDKIDGVSGDPLREL